MSTENTTREMIKKLLSDCNITLKEVVTEMNNRHPEDSTTPQNITNKLARQTIKFNEVMEIADIVGYEIKFVKTQVMDRKDAMKILNYLKMAKDIIDSYDNSDDIRMDKSIADDCLDCLSAIEYCINNS